MSLTDILECVGFSKRTFYRVLKLYRDTGNVVKAPSNRRGRPRKLLFEDVEYLIALVHHRPDWFLDELLGLMEHNRFISVHFTTIHRELVHAGILLKKLKKIAKERNEDLRADFIRQMAQYAPEELCFLDEVHKDERTLIRRYGRARKGKRAIMQGVFVRGRRVSAEGCLSVDGMVTGTVVEGSMTSDKFLYYLEHSLVR